MRDFFINSLEKLIVVIVAIMIIGTIIAALVVMSTEGLLLGIAVLIGGAINSIIFGGMMFLGFGIYDGVQRTANALENK
ncbi:MAG: hypothetical protein JKY41_16045 [Rhodobacteraceae bacterium]|nr:hypothetical protein [Paracoccaceae bacterium]